MSYELGSLGTYVSGAGPTIIAMIDAENADAFGKSCVSIWRTRASPAGGWRSSPPTPTGPRSSSSKLRPGNRQKRR